MAACASQRREGQELKSSANVETKFRELLDLVEKLRSPDGCPWDRAQKKGDIGRYLMEEAYEVLEALEGSSPENVQEELGDLLFQILFLARMAEEAGEFDIAAVLGGITEKMIRRHPHVFGDTTVEGVEEVRTNWERIKTEVEHKGDKGSPICDGIPRSLSTLARAQRITARTAEAGFDWPDTAGVLDKVEEELAELRAALEAKDPKRMQDEAGDLLFTLVNLCRFAKVDAETALRSSMRKFINRFSHIERELAARGKAPKGSSPAEMDRIWEEAKKNERNSMLELMRKRRSVRKFKKDRIAQTAMDDLKEAALRSPSSRGNRPWKFFFVQDAEVITRLSRCKESGSAFLKDASLAVVVCGDETVSDVWIEDCSIAAIIVHLAAESLGLGSCWIQVRNRRHNAESTSEDYVRNILGIAYPFRVLSIIAIGLPDEIKAGHPYESLDHGKVDAPVLPPT
ncbi:MAG: nucleoside triphosphate pyrophosphohydrolase [Proteobacteria bacterium]|nr:nucleoside triphosphate pyrophosphohydrolase [Pseudomonadota bacterium]